MKKILVIRFSSIGDIVLTTAAIRCLKKQIPGVKVHFLTKEKMKAVTEHNSYIDKFHYYKDDINVLADELINEDFDYVIDLHKNLRTWLLQLKMINARAVWHSYHKLSIQKFILTKFKIDIMPKRHIALRCIDALQPLGVIYDGEGLNYFISEADKIKDNDLPVSHQFGYVALVIGGSYFTKKLPVEKLIHICSKIKYPIVLLGGKEDAEEGKIIAASDDAKIFNACGKFTLNESADIVRRSHLVISHDTGLQYIASAYNKPTLAIWGGTSPKLQVEPFYGTANPSLYKNFIVPNLSCQPCSNFGTKKCPRGHFKCMKLQDTDLIASTAMQMLKQ